MMAPDRQALVLHALLLLVIVVVVVEEVVVVVVVVVAAAKKITSNFHAYGNYLKNNQF